MPAEASHSPRIDPKRMLLALAGTCIYCVGVNMFVVPAGLYSGGTLGLCQILRTLLTEYLHISFGRVDVSGIFYYLVNIPIFIFAWVKIDRWFVVKSLIAVTAMSLLLAVIPTVPLLAGDTISCCLLGGVISGLGAGLVLRTGCTLGGMDVVSLMIIRKHRDFSVGKMSLGLNLLVYAICMVMFNIPTAIYSIVYSALYSTAVDRTHSQNIDVEVTIITKQPVALLEQEVFNGLHRGVTQLKGTGAYTDEAVNVLFIVLSKYEVSLLRHIIKRHDPNAFFIVKDHVKIYGNYTKKL